MPKRVLGSISGVFRVLRQFAFVQDTWGPRELSRAVGLSKSTTLRILQTMVEENFLITVEKINKYSIGPELWRIGLGLKNRVNLSKITVPILEKYVREINETLHFFRYDRGAVIFDEIVECTHAVRYHVNPGIPYEIEKGAAGKVILAFLPVSMRQEILKRLKRNPSVNMDELSKKIAETKHNGYSFTMDERGTGVIGFAAPIFGPDNDLLGGIGLAVPGTRYRSEDHNRYADVVRSCAAEVSFVTRPNGDLLKKNDEKQDG
jgi:DNA-binding IclR family transcriptional regulator